MFNNGVNTHGLRWRPRLKVWRSSNNIFRADELIAYSYGHWCYFRVIKGLKVFNAHYYSQATRGHQSELRTVLKKLKIKIDVEIDTRSSLDGEDLKGWLGSAYAKLFELEIKAARSKRPDAWAQRHRLREIKDQRKAIQRLERLTKLSKARIREIKAACETRDAKDREYDRMAAADRREGERLKRAETKDLLDSSWVNVG